MRDLVIIALSIALLITVVYIYNARKTNNNMQRSSVGVDTPTNTNSKINTKTDEKPNSDIKTISNPKSNSKTYDYDVENNMDDDIEYMAPLYWGTYDDVYKYGTCNIGSMERSACEIGSCPLGTTVTNEEYCNITHAQDQDPIDRINNVKKCISMLENCD